MPDHAKRRRYALNRYPTSSMASAANAYANKRSALPVHSRACVALPGMNTPAPASTRRVDRSIVTRPEPSSTKYTSACSWRCSRRTAPGGSRATPNVSAALSVAPALISVFHQTFPRSAIWCAGHVSHSRSSALTTTGSLPISRGYPSPGPGDTRAQTGVGRDDVEPLRPRIVRYQRCDDVVGRVAAGAFGEDHLD